MPGDSFVERIRNRPLRDLYAYWAGKRGDRALPTRAEIDPVDIPKLLPDILLLDIEAAPRRFRFRLVGTRFATTFGEPLQGRYLDELLTGRWLAYWTERLSIGVRDVRPDCGVNVIAWQRRHNLQFEWLLLPLGSERAVNMFLAMGVFEGAPGLLGSRSSALKKLLERCPTPQDAPPD
jgi:hypothetical protein